MTDSLSSWWAASSHRAVRAAGSVEQRLALALGPVRSIIRVVDSHVPAMSVDWAQVGKDAKDKPLSMSATDFRGGRIAINPLPIIEGKLDTGDAIDIVAGFGLHEASHAEESRDRFEDLLVKKTSRWGTRVEEREEPAFSPFKVAIWLWNVVEDVRIESVTGRKWPGTKPYFAKLLDWMWDRNPPEIDDFASAKIEDRMKVIFLACRYPDKIDGLTVKTKGLMGGHGRRKPLKMDAIQKAEVAWWQAWQADYLAGRVDTKETIQRGLDHLALDPETAKEMKQQAAAEAKEREAGEKVRAQLERLLREGAEMTGVCITADGEVQPLSAAQAAAVNKLLREGLMTVKPLFTDNNNRCAEVRVSKPEETADSRKAYIGKPTPLVDALRTSLVLRSARPEFDLKLQRSGHIDDEELWRLGTGDLRVFSEHVIESRPDVALGLLVDMSGSMVGNHLRIAQRLAQTFLWALHDADGVELRVWGHTGDIGSEGSDIYRLWEPGDDMRRLGLIATQPHGDNYDGFAIAHCVNEMREAPQPQKVLIVLSDGYPAGMQYGGIMAQQHMKRVCDWARKQGVEVFQIAIDDSLRAQDQERMFGPGQWLPYSTDARLPKDLTRVLARVTA